MRIVAYQFRQHQGISLVELVVYIFIMTMMLLLTSKFAIDMIRGQQRSSAVQHLHQTVRRAIATMNYDLRFATAINGADSVFDNDAGILVFTDAAGATVRYELSSAKLLRTYNAGIPEQLTTDIVTLETFRVQHIYFTPRNLESVRISLIASTGIPSTIQFYRHYFATAVTLR